MSVNIDPAGQNIFSGGVDDFGGVVAWEILTKGCDLAIVDGNVTCVCVCGSGYASVYDDRVKAHWLPPAE